jgi:putative membrane protein
MSRTIQLALAAACMAAMATSAHAASEKSFLEKALKGDNSEVALGQMAEDKGSTQATRDFGKMLHDDHAQAKQEVLPVAQAHGVADTDAMTAGAKLEQVKLNLLKGRAFDHEFAKYMVKDHKADIAEFGKEARNGHDDTADLARKTLPTLRKHLETAETVERETAR